MAILFIITLLFLSGCAPYLNTSQERLLTLPQQHSQFDAKLAWDVTTNDKATVIEGVVKNIRYFEMDELEIWVWVLDGKGRETHRAVSFVPRLRENEAAPFTIELPRLDSGTKLSFMYRYIGYDGGGESGGADRWHQTFESAVP
jgi:hypothetical protein